ncbi:tannase/feruloyl esterase family alpha/beta hydrolase [Burkholderia cenocepacia]|nr:tannase/feruloyl esterase family alpha/beta hydrolase [Burkholderia cenocepacia]
MYGCNGQFALYTPINLMSIASLAVAISMGLTLTACNGDSVDATPQFVQSAQTCTALKSKRIDASLIGEPTTGAVVTAATYLSGVPDTPNAAGTAIVQATPDYCQVQMDISPVDNAAPVIKAQVNLPTNWNGKKLQFGGGGFNGTLITGVQPSRNAPANVPIPLTQGYMTAGTDSGHQTLVGGDSFSFALNSEALTNFAYAAYKKTNDVAIQIGLLYYGKKPTKSYYMGASEGGREAMTMAQRYPNDYDGIVAIDPVMNWSGLQTFGNYVGGILQSKPGGWLNGKSQLVHDTVVSACDALDGITDGVVSNYFTCKPVADAALAAKRCPSGGDEGSQCFSDAQLAVINQAHSGYQFDFARASGMTVYAGFNYGSEGLPGNWERWMTGTVSPTTGPSTTGISQLYAYGNGYVRYFIAQNSNFDPLTYNPDTYKDRVVQVSNIMDATNPDLTAFFNRGGKLILREDMGDSAQSPFTGLNYWNAVVAKMGQATVSKFFAAYVSTGLPHTSGGVAAGTKNAPSYGTPGSVDLLPLLEAWSEKGVAPSDSYMLVNTQPLPPYAVTASKPMCRYGTYPRYTGADASGGSNGANYACVTGS